MINKQSDIVDVIVTNSNLLLNPELILKLNVKAGDRIVIGYIEKEGNLVPIISVGEEGNKLNKSGSVSFRGKQRNTLTQFGTQFWAGDFNGTYCELEGNGIPVYTDIKKATEAYITKEIILDINYNITYRTEFEF